MLITSEFSYSQVSVIINPPPSNQLHIEDLWKVQINNMSGIMKDIYLIGTITESEKGIIFAAQTKVFRIPSGISQLKYKQISPVHINYSNDEYSDIAIKTGGLPEGEYDYCIKVIDASTGDELVTNCLPQLQNLSNTFAPQLLAPIDGVEVTEKYPIFTWLPATGNINPNNINYQIKIVQILDGQSANDAVNANPPWFVTELKSSLLKYPISAREFESEEKYAWQVTAVDENKMILAESEISPFVCICHPMLGPLGSLEGMDSETEVIEYSRRTMTPGTFIASPKEWKMKSPVMRNDYLFSSDSVGNIPPIKFSGITKFYAQSANRQGTNSEIPKNFWRWDLNTTLSIYDIPIGFDAFVSSEQKNIRQNINMFKLQLSPKQILMNEAEKIKGNILFNFLSMFSNLGIGTCYPTYSPLTISGIAVTGVDIEFTPGIFYLAFTTGRTQKSVQGSPMFEPTYKRNLLSAKIGVGEKQYSHFYLTFSKSWDDSNSVNPDTFYTTPQENYLVGSEVKICLFEQIFNVDGEVVASVLTRDIRAAELETEKIPGWVKKLVKPKISTSADFAYRINSELNLPTKTKFGFSFKMIGPGFVTHGVPYLRNDLRQYEVKAEQDFYKKIFIAKVYYKNSIDNLIPWKNTRTTISSYGINFSLRLKELPYLQINYSPYFQYNDSKSIERKVDNKTQMLSLTSGYFYKINTLNASSNVFYSLNKSNTMNSYNNYSTNNISFQQAVGFEFPLNLAASCSYMNSEYSSTNSKIISIEFNGTYTAFEEWMSTIGINFTNEKDNDKKTGFYFTSTFPIWYLAEVEIRAERNMYRDLYSTLNNYNEFIFQFTISKRL